MTTLAPPLDARSLRTPSARIAASHRGRHIVGGSSGASAVRCRQLIGTTIEVVDHPWFHEPDAEERIRELERSVAADPSRQKAGEADRDRAALPGHLRALCRTPLLTPVGERAAFLRFNWERHRARELRGKLRAGDRTATTIGELESALDRIDRARNRIVLANTRLVVSVARTFATRDLPFDELLAAGMPPLLRSVELFDVSRGYRFSTYATWAIRNHFLRVRKRHRRDREQYRTGEAEAIDALETPTVDLDLVTDREALVREKIVGLLDELDGRDRTIVEARFGLNGHGHGRTFAEIGTLVGLSKERVRQLTQRALDQLRESHPEVSWLIGA